MATASTQHRQQLVRRGQRLEYFTIGYNSIKGFVFLVAAPKPISNLLCSHHEKTSNAFGYRTVPCTPSNASGINSRAIQASPE
jgi:hypothetical protein